MRLATQWTIAPNGDRVGLRYETLPVVLRAHQVERSQWPQVVEDLQAMEWHALKVMRATEG